MKRLLPIALCLALLLTGCASGKNDREYQEGDHVIYLLADEREAAGEDAILPLYTQLDLPEDASAEETASALVERLIQGSASGESPFRKGTTLQSLTIQGRRAYVDFASYYTEEGGITRSLADYCLTLTLTQLDEISAVSVTVMGRELPDRDKQILMERDVLLSTMGDVIETVPVTLYFYDANGALVAEERELDLYEGQSLAESLIIALLDGPAVEGHQSVLPEGFSVNAIRVEEGACYLSLPSQSIEVLPESVQAQEEILWALANSIYSMEGVGELHILVDGEEIFSFGEADISEVAIRPDEQEKTER